MKYLLSLLVGFTVADGLLTYFLIRHGLGREGNPLLLPLLGDDSFLTIKLVGTILCVLILWDIYKHFPRLALVSTSCFVVLYAVIVIWNLGVFFMA